MSKKLTELVKKMEEASTTSYINFTDIKQLFNEIYEADCIHEYYSLIQKIKHKTNDGSYGFFDYLCVIKRPEFETTPKIFLDYLSHSKQYKDFAYNLILSDGSVSIYKRWEKASDFIHLIKDDFWDEELSRFCISYNIRGLPEILKKNGIPKNPFSSSFLTFGWDGKANIENYVNSFLNLMNFLESEGHQPKVSRILEHGARFFHHPAIKNYCQKLIKNEKSCLIKDQKALEAILICMDQQKVKASDIFKIYNFSNPDYWDFRSSLPLSRYLDDMIPKMTKKILMYYSAKEKDGIITATNYDSVKDIYIKSLLKDIKSGLVPLNSNQPKML